MDRLINYPGAIPLETDLLNTNKNVMIAFGMALQAVLGTSTLVDGLACTPTGPASLQVLVGPGSIYSYANVDGTAFSSLAADTTHQIVKQGINLGTLTMSCPAPGTVGQSINYLIEAAYQDTDAVPVTLPYYNSSNPTVAYSGPANSGAAQNTVRQGQCIVQVKAGVSATTGSQVTPAVDAGYTALWVVTVANGQTTITSGNIVAAGSAPFLTEKLATKISQATGDARYLQIANAQMGVVGQMRGGKMSVAAASATATFTADEVIVETALGGPTTKLASYSQVVNLATTGAGAMDTGAAPVSGYVALYAIYGISGTSILAMNATSAVAPSVYAGGHMPAGYTQSALIGVWPTNSSGQFMAGNQRDRTLNFANVQVLNSTSATSLISLSIAAAVPKNAVSCGGYLNASTASPTNLNLSVASDANSTGLQITAISQATASACAFLGLIMATAQTIYYSGTITSGTPQFNIFVSSYSF